MASSQEWDWPPPRNARVEQLEARIRAEQIVINPRRVPPRKRPLGYRVADGFTHAVFTLCRIVLAIALAGILLASIGLLGAVLRV